MWWFGGRGKYWWSDKLSCTHEPTEGLDQKQSDIETAWDSRMACMQGSFQTMHHLCNHRYQHAKRKVGSVVSGPESEKVPSMGRLNRYVKESGDQSWTKAFSPSYVTFASFCDIEQITSLNHMPVPFERQINSRISGKIILHYPKRQQSGCLAMMIIADSSMAIESRPQTVIVPSRSLRVFSTYLASHAVLYMPWQKTKPCV